MTWRRQFRYDPDIGYTFIPNLQIRIPHESGGYLVKTNALGFREDKSPTAVFDRQRVFVFGDSFTAGDGVSNGLRFTDELQRQLGNVDVFNFGLPGSGTDQQFIAYRKFAAHLPCTVLVVAVLVENIRRITSQFRVQAAEDGSVVFQAKPFFDLVDGQLVRRHLPVPLEPMTKEELARTAADASVDTGGRFQGLRGLVSSLGLKDAVQRLTEYQPVPDYNQPESPGWQLMEALLRAWRAAHDGPMLVVPLPLYQHVEETAAAQPYQSRFNELAAPGDIMVHDVLPDLLQQYDRTQRRAMRFKVDVHLTPLGHQAIARSLSPAIGKILAR